MTLPHFAVNAFVYGTVTHKILSVVCAGREHILNALLGSAWSSRKPHQQHFFYMSKDGLTFINLFFTHDYIKIASFTFKIS